MATITINGFTTGPLGRKSTLSRWIGDWARRDRPDPFAAPERCGSHYFLLGTRQPLDKYKRGALKRNGVTQIDSVPENASLYLCHAPQLGLDDVKRVCAENGVDAAWAGVYPTGVKVLSSLRGLGKASQIVDVVFHEGVSPAAVLGAVARAAGVKPSDLKPNGRKVRLTAGAECLERLAGLDEVRHIEPAEGGQRLFPEELRAVETRRTRAGFETAPAAADSLVGLALSGGGIRSACFNLGLLQALYRFGVLRYVDFLSTVSGGGYVGAHLTSLIHNHLKEGERVTPDNLPILADDGGRQPECVARLIRRGTYLNSTARMANRYLAGLVFNNVAFFSLVVCLCFLAAFAWRAIDYPWVVHGALRSQVHDWGRQLMPTSVLAALWLAAWLFSYLFRGPSQAGGAVARSLLIAAALSLPVSLVVLLANDEITFDLRVVEVLSGRTDIQTPRLLGPFIGLVGTGLLPFLRPSALLASGLRPKKWWEKWVFGYASGALLFGVPLLLIYCFAQENISGHGTNSVSEIRNSRYGDFIRHLCEKSCQGDAVSQTLYDRLIPEDVRRLPSWAQQAAAPDSRLGTREEFTAALVGANYRNSLGPSSWPLREYLVHTLNNVLTNEDAFAVWALKDGAAEFRRRKEEYKASRLNELDGADAKKAAERAVTSTFQEIDDLLAEFRTSGAALARAKARKLNHYLLLVCYPEFIPEDMKPIKRIVVIQKDQEFRLWGMAIALGVFAVFCVVNLNATSLHEAYRDRLAETYIHPDREGSRDVRLDGLTATSKGGPCHLISTTANFHPTVWELLQGRWRPENCESADNFLLTEHYCGSASTGFRRTAEYGAGGDGLTLATSVALSGAAVSPFLTENALAAFLLTVANIRLGQWLPNPRFAAAPWSARGAFPRLGRAVLVLVWWSPLVLWVLRGMFRHALSRTFCFLTDGGHFDNLGLWPLLRRRCRLIIVSDASCDNKYRFEEFLKLCRRACLREGIRFVEVEEQVTRRPHERVNLDPLRPPIYRTDFAGDKAPDDTAGPKTAQWLSDRHFFVARIEYPEASDTVLADDPARMAGKEASVDRAGGGPGPKYSYLVYLKSSVTGDENVDLLGHWASHIDFPHDPTADQLFTGDQVESYRQLGYHVGKAVFGNSKPSTDEPPPLTLGKDARNDRRFSIHKWVQGWLDKRQPKQKQLLPRQG